MLQLFVTAVSFLWKKILFSFCFLCFNWFPTFRIINYFTLFNHSNGLVPYHGSFRCFCCAHRGSMSLRKGNTLEKDYILPEHASFFWLIYFEISWVSNPTTEQQCSTAATGFYPYLGRGPTCIIHNVKAK